MAVDKFETPLYSVSEAARFLDVARSTFNRWAHGSVRRSADGLDVVDRPTVTAVAGGRVRDASVPFVGLAEGLVLAAIRRAGVPLQRIRPAIDVLQREIGLPHALASQRLYTDGAEVLYDFAGESDRDDVGRLVVVRSGQRVFSEVVQQYLRRIVFGDDGYAELLSLPSYSVATVIADPRRSFGQPIFQVGGARVEDAVGLFLAGESLPDVAAEFGVPEPELEDAIRVAARRAA
jgi:uncharacterized protein (DUF433 family)